MQAQSRTTDTGNAIIWCQPCGIPYAAGTPFCSNCGKELAANTDATPLKAQDLSAPPVLLDEESSVDDRDASAEIDLDAIYPAAPPSLMGRIRKRPRPLSEDEVEAAAAMIIARAQEASANGADEESPGDALALLPDLLPDPVVEAALLQRREQDRKWIIAGIVCSIILIIIALAFSRLIAGGLPQR
jgi:hypothetical protein